MLKKKQFRDFYFICRIKGRLHQRELNLTAD
jgi:hypothetical protein